MRTTAQRIAKIYREDGQLFYRGADRHIETLARRFDRWPEEANNGSKKYRFSDGSALVVAEGCWDLALNSDPDCFCFEGINFCDCEED